MRSQPSHIYLLIAILLAVLLGVTALMRIPPLNPYSASYVETCQAVIIKPTRSNIARPVKHLWLDLESGKLGDIRPTPKQAGIATCDSVSSSNSITYQYLAATDLPSQGLTWVDFSLPIGYPSLVGGRYAVCASQQNLHYIDLHDPSPHPKTVKINQISGDAFVSYCEGNFFVLKEYNAKKPTQNGFAGIYRISGQGPELVAEVDLGPDLLLQDKVLYSTDRKTTRIQRHAFPTGERLDDLPLSEELLEQIKQDKALSLGLISPVLLLVKQDLNATVGGAPETTYTHLNLETQQVYATPEGNWLPARGELFRVENEAGKRKPPAILYESSVNGLKPALSRLAAFSYDENKTLWVRRYETEPTTFGHFEGQLLLGDGRFGLTIDLIDPFTGQTTRRLQPIRHLVWLLPLVVICLLVWTRCWFIITANVLPAWASLTTLATGGLALFTLYLWAWGFIPSYPSVPIFNYCHGIFLGLTTATLAWLVLGRKRIGTRYLPVIGVLSCLLVVARYIFSDDLRYAGEAFVTTLVPACLTMLPVLGLRWLGVQWFRDDHSAPGPDQPASRIVMRDFFIAAACAALLLTTLKPVMDRLQVPEVSELVIIGSVCMTLGSLFIVLTCQHRNHHIAISCELFAFALIASLLVEVLYPFVFSHSLFADRMDYAWVLFRVIATSLVCLHVVLYAYRCQGWRLAKFSGSSVRSNAEIR